LVGRCEGKLFWGLGCGGCGLGKRHVRSGGRIEMVEMVGVLDVDGMGVGSVARRRDLKSEARGGMLVMTNEKRPCRWKRYGCAC
jgi:hypothetical protein